MVKYKYFLDANICPVDRKLPLSILQAHAKDEPYVDKFFYYEERAAICRNNVVTSAVVSNEVCAIDLDDDDIFACPPLPRDLSCISQG